MGALIGGPSAETHPLRRMVLTERAGSQCRSIQFIGEGIMLILSQCKLESAVTQANTKISSFLASEKPVLDPLFESLEEVSHSLPVKDPTAQQETTLYEY